MAGQPLTFLVVKYGAPIPMAGELVDMYRVTRPDPYEESLRLEQYRVEDARRQVELADLWSQVLEIPNPGLQVVLQLHAPDFDSRSWPTCNQCEGDELDPADWPCATVEAIASWHTTAVGTKKAARLRRSVYGRDGFACRDCGASFDHVEPYQGEPVPGLTLGHIVPKVLGGRRNVINLITQCRPCNEDLGGQIWLSPRYPNGRPA